MSIRDELLREIAPGAWAIRLPIPWPPGGVTSYLFRGEDGYFLIDCGLNTDDTFKVFDAAFRELGIDWRAITKILISHLHPDHVGGAARARRLSGAPVLMHPRESPLVAPRAEGAFFAQTRTYLAEHGVEPETIDEIEAGARDLSGRTERLVVDGELREGERFGYVGGEIEALCAPGHSPALLAFHDAGRRILYSTDAVLERITPNIGVHAFYPGNPLGEYFDTLARLEGLEVDLVVPGHGNPFEDFAGWIQSARRHHRKRLGKIRDAVDGETRSGWAVAGAIWGTRRPMGERRMALAEGVAHLEFLARTGEVEKAVVDGVVRWRAI